RQVRREVGRGEDGMDPGEGAGPRGVDGTDPRVWEGAPHEYRVQHPRPNQVGDEPAPPREQFGVLAPPDGLPYPTARVLSRGGPTSDLSPERTLEEAFPPRQLEAEIALSAPWIPFCSGITMTCRAWRL